MRKNLMRGLVMMVVGAVVGVGVAGAQFDPEGGGAGAGPKEPVKGADDPIKLSAVTVDKAKGTVTLAAAFWNQKMTDWVEVAVCGRPSDFLHETVVSIMSTKTIMMDSMRSAGFHDADEWVSNVQEFPRIRGDRFMILLKVTRDGKEETYSLDECLEYQGWGVSAGPYGWMYKGDPGAQREAPATGPAATNAAGAAGAEADRTKILRSDPQIALVLKGIQHQSDSFAENPMAYDDWVFPMMRYGRNLKLLPSAVFDSNGGVPVTLVIQKVNEEEFVTGMAKVWHDKPFAEYMLKQLPTAKGVDAAKGELWGLLGKLKQLQAAAPGERDAGAVAEIQRKLPMLAAEVEKGYAEMDAAWADWASEHPVFETTDDGALAELKGQAKLWEEHMDLKRERAEKLAAAEEARFALQGLLDGKQDDAAMGKEQKLRGVELEARSSAMIAEDSQPLRYWKDVQTRVNPAKDPRTDYIRQIGVQVAMLESRGEMAKAGLAYGRALQSEGASAVESAKKVYVLAVVRMKVAELKVRLADLDFEIEKREGFEEDTELAGFKKEKAEVESELKAAEAAGGAGGATQAATLPAGK